MFNKINNKNFKTSKGEYRVESEDFTIDIFNKEKKGEIILFFRNFKIERAFTEKSFNKFMKQTDLVLNIQEIKKEA